MLVISKYTFSIWDHEEYLSYFFLKYDLIETREPSSDEHSRDPKGSHIQMMDKL